MTSVPIRRNEPETRSLIAYLVAPTGDKGVTLNQTKLVKLLYLVEVERIASGRDPLTGLDWVFYLRVGSPPVSDGEAMSEPCPGAVVRADHPLTPSDPGRSYGPLSRIAVARALQECRRLLHPPGVLVGAGEIVPGSGRRRRRGVDQRLR